VEITEIRITLRDEEKLKGFANVTFDNAFVVAGSKLLPAIRDFLCPCQVASGLTERIRIFVIRSIIRCVR